MSHCAVLCCAGDRLERNQHPVFGYPTEMMRFSWSTCREVLDRKGAARVDWWDSVQYCVMI